MCQNNFLHSFIFDFFYFLFHLLWLIYLWVKGHCHCIQILYLITVIYLDNKPRSWVFCFWVSFRANELGMMWQSLIASRFGNKNSPFVAKSFIFPILRKSFNNLLFISLGVCLVWRLKEDILSFSPHGYGYFFS